MKILQRTLSHSPAAVGVAITTCALVAGAALSPASAGPPSAETAVTSDPRASSTVSHPSPDRSEAMRAPKYCVREAGRVVCRRYAKYYRWFSAGSHPSGVGASFTVHRPKQLRGRSSHSLAEMALHQPGRLGNFIEVGWRRLPGGRPRLFVFRWTGGDPSCYDRCGGFRVRGPGKRPGSVLRPGTSVRVEWRHHHHRWNLHVNGRWSGFYPDRLWNGHFKRVRMAEFFGEVAFARSGRGRCVDMGNGRSPRRQSARVYKIRYRGTSAGYRAGGSLVTAPRLYSLKRTSPRSFKYGGPGPC